MGRSRQMMIEGSFMEVHIIDRLLNRGGHSFLILKDLYVTATARRFASPGKLEMKSRET